MKNWLIYIIIALLAALLYTYGQYRKVNDDWKRAEANVKAYDNMLSESESKSTALELTVSQLNTFQDSILKELNATRKELGIKDKRIKALQAVSSTFTKTDTITVRDTIFKEPTFALDTIVGDGWYTTEIGLKYPSTVAVKPTFRSEKHIVVSTKKETVNPPSKFFLFRWFQKKHTVLKVDVVENNPYVENQESRYVEIIR